MLADLQRHLADIYCLDRPYDVREFVITDPVMARALGEDALLRNTRETLLVSEDDAGLAVSLYLDGAMLERLESSNPVERLRAELLDDLWRVVEGISHFNCIVWKATRERSVSLLELELQGEIDKYVSTLLLRNREGHRSDDRRRRQPAPVAVRRRAFPRRPRRRAARSLPLGQ